jgi:phosphoheptose isomerase
MRNSSKILKAQSLRRTRRFNRFSISTRRSRRLRISSRNLCALENKLLVCGNGGNAADASHFATEFVVRFTKDRPAYPAICLSGDGGLLTAAGNDYASKRMYSALGRAPLSVLPTAIFVDKQARSFAQGRNSVKVMTT